VVEEVLRLRAAGLSQGDVAARLGLDRTFVSRLETIGEIRRGRRVALVAFPVGNAEALLALAARHGVERTLVWSDQERRAFLAGRSGEELVNGLLDLVAELRHYERVVLVASERWVELGRSLLGPDLVAVVLGPTPLGRDQEVDLAEMDRLLAAVLD
jgi:transcriptional regulator with XRE-family HTH domain